RAFARLEQTGNQLYQRRFSTTAAPNNCDVLAGADIESDPLQDSRRFRPAVAKSKVAQFDMTFKRGDRPQLRSITALFRLLLENIIQPIDKNYHTLELIPDTQDA